VPPFAGFWSKDEILLSAFNKGGAVGYGLWVVGLLTAVLTAFYMSRQVFLTFYGEPRWKHAHSHGDEAAQSAAEVDDAAEAPAGAADDEHAMPKADLRRDDEGHSESEIHPHESPWQMTFPLVVLALLAIVGGALNLPFLARLQTLQHWLEPVVGHAEVATTVGSSTKILLATIATVGALIGIGAAVVLYLRRKFADRPQEPELLANAWYYDSAIASFMGGPGRKAFEGIAWFDAHVVDGAVNGVAKLVGLGGTSVRRLQSGYVRSYALSLAVGAIVLVAVFTLRGAVH